MSLNIFEDTQNSKARWARFSFLSVVLACELLLLSIVFFPNAFFLWGTCFFLVVFAFCFGMTVGLTRAGNLLVDHMNEFKRDE